MIKMVLTFLFLTLMWLTGSLEWAAEFFSAHNLANIALVVLGIIIASAASQVRLILEKVESILWLYANYTHPDSEDGEKLSEAERQRLLEFFLNELRSLLKEFGPGIFAKIGKGVQATFKAVGLR